MSLELAGVGVGANTSLGPRPGLLGEVPPGVASGVPLQHEESLVDPHREETTAI